MSYKNKTRRLEIPVVGDGDRITGQDELLKNQIIENYLLAGSKNIKNCIFDDGYFNVSATSDTTYEVTLSATGHNPSACGIVNGFYFEGIDPQSGS